MKFLDYLSPSGYHWDIILLIIFCPLYNAFWGSFGVYQLLIVPIIFLFVIYKIQEKEKTPIKDYVYIYLAILIQDALLTMIYGERSLFQEMKVYVIVLLVMIHPVNVKTRSIIYPLMATVGIIVGYYMLSNQDLVGGYRLSLQIGEVLQDPNWIAIFLFSPFCLGLSLLQSGKRLLRVFGVGGCLFSFYVVFLTGSRGALIGMIMALLVWMGRLFRQSKLISAVIGILAVLVMAFLFVTFYAPDVNTEIIDRYTGEDMASGIGRRMIWEAMLVEYTRGGFVDLVFGRGPLSCVRDVGWSAHNVLLEQLFQMGIVGLFMLILFFVKLVKDTIRCKNDTGLLILTALIVLSFSTPIWGHIFFMTTLAMVVYVNNEITRQNKRI